MKITGLVLAFYILLLAAMPCCLIDNCPDDKTRKAAGHENRDEDCGNCSPFFSCEGCGAATIAYQPVQFEWNTIKQKPVYTSYRHASLPEAEYEFWQPPKLSWS